MIDLLDFVPQPPMQALAWTLIHFLWQGALLGAAAAVALKIARPEHASTRYTIGVATLGLMLLTCAGTFIAESRQQADEVDASIAALISSPATATTAAATAARTETATPATDLIRSIASWPPALLGPTALFIVVFAWAAGVIALSIRLLGGWILTRRLAYSAVTAVSPVVTNAALEIS
ncbi:MAG: hypothetical protein ABI983_07760, partial [Acidobacteriota bacterium]